MKSIGRIINGILSLIFWLVIAGGCVAGYYVRAPFPQTDGEFQVAGLGNRVEVYRDEWGVPQIYANNVHDLFFAQGYVQAQDRFWQMEFFRRVGNGRLSELFGPATVKTDRFVRTLGWNRVAAEEAARMDATTRVIVQAYADGVNAYIAHQQNLGLEFTLLRLNGVAYEPEPWTIENTLTWIKAMAWDLGGNMSAELDRVMVMQLMGEQAMNEIYPLFDYTKPVIVPAGVDYDQLEVGQLRADMQALQGLESGAENDIGSNNWVISGALTDSGRPYLANDPHLGIQMPSIWYEIGLHCNSVGPACPFDVTGFTFAGAPGVIIGHNQRIAWGITNLGPDVQDLYLERMNPDNPNQYEVNGQWVDAEIVIENIIVQGRLDQPDPNDPNMPFGVYDLATDSTTITIQIQITRHGPLINAIESGARDLVLTGSFEGREVPVNLGLALRWTALDPEETLRSFLLINQATNFDEFREALRFYGSPAQNFVYADVDSNIGYVAPGRIPIRAGGDGLLPVPGWNDNFEWIGFIPYDELPRAFNPPEGYIVTANNAIVGPGYPYLISLDWARGYRAQRIVQMIEEQRGEPITKDTIAEMQGDNLMVSAQEIMPFLAEIPRYDSDRLNSIHDDLVTEWDFRVDMDSSQAALYQAFWANLIRDTVGDNLPADLWPGVGGRAMLFMRRLMDDPGSSWWDDVNTPDLVENRNDILKRAFAEAVDQLSVQLGNNSNNWRWGALHTATFRNATFGSSGVFAIEGLFNRGPVETGGSGAIVNATSWSPIYDESTGQFDYRVNWLPSMRMIVDISNFNESRAMHTTGQSGHPYHPNYNDMIDPWRLIEYHPQLWNRDAIEAVAGSYMLLRP